MAAASRDIELSQIAVQEANNAESDKTKSAGDEAYGKTQLMFRFLKLTFKNQSLEELYKRSVYRQYQFLLLIVCLLMVFLAVIGLIITGATGKVWAYQLASCMHAHCSLPLPQLSALPIPDQELSDCVSIANLTFAWVSFSLLSLTSSFLSLPGDNQCCSLWCSLSHPHLDSDCCAVHYPSCSDLCGSHIMAEALPLLIHCLGSPSCHVVHTVCRHTTRTGCTQSPLNYLIIPL